MAHSRRTNTNYLAKDFVESCGAILFDLSHPQTPQVCLLHYVKNNEWLLAKGRRNCGESREQAAIREVVEETGYRCHLHPIRMTTRAPSMSEPANVGDEPRSYPDLTEPFMLTSRQFKGKEKLKLIWWYIAALDKEGSDEKAAGEPCFRAEFFSCEDALQKLTFESDRGVLAEAIRLIGG
jgi:8-oxo-dGTP pyrophosphatase MutT (NUDIX family)